MNLWSLAKVFISPNSQELISVYYFSAYADWIPDAKQRHLRYVKALIAAGVTPVMGKFKEKDRKCPSCENKWKAHEEKIKVEHLERCLMAEHILDVGGNLIVSRPPEYTPPLGQMI